MTEIVGFVGMSHSPFATMTPPQAPSEPGGQFVADTERMAATVAGRGRPVSRTASMYFKKASASLVRLSRLPPLKAR